MSWLFQHHFFKRLPFLHCIPLPPCLGSADCISVGVFDPFTCSLTSLTLSQLLRLVLNLTSGRAVLQLSFSFSVIFPSRVFSPLFPSPRVSSLLPPPCPCVATASQLSPHPIFFFPLLVPFPWEVRIGRKKKDGLWGQRDHESKILPLTLSSG